MTNDNCRNERQDDGVLVKTYRPGDLVVKVTMLPWLEYLALKHKEVNFTWDEVGGKSWVRTRPGVWILYRGKLPRMGPIQRTVLMVIMAQPGRQHDRASFKRLTGHYYFGLKGCLDRHVRDLRRIFRENHSNSQYVMTSRQPYRVWWNQDRSFRHILPVVDED